MNALFRTENRTWREIQSNLLFIGPVELLIYNGGLMIKYALQSRFDLFTPLVGPEFGLYYNANFWIIIPILLTLAFMGLTCPGALRVFTEGSSGRKLKSLGKGLALGCTLMGLLTLLTALSGAVTFTYNRFDWRLIPAILPLFIQCTAEEMLLRGYVPAVAGERHSWDAVCFVSGTLFIFHHILNMEYFGFNAMFCLDIFLMGVLFCLLVRQEGNFWIACGIHTAWNYVQVYLFGLPNSGEQAPIGLFQGVLNTGNAFYQEVYGYEGSIATAVLAGALICVLICRLRKAGKI